MIEISGLKPSAPIDRPTTRSSQASASFSVATPARGRAAEAASETPAVMLAGLLALQSDETDEARDREAKRRGQDMLAELAALQRALLSDAAGGAVPVEQLRRLERLATEIPPPADPRLREVMDAITLRVRVELARYRI